MITNRWGVRWLVAAALGALAAQAQAQPSGWPGSGERPGAGERTGPGLAPQGRTEAMVRELGLSESQLEKVREIEDGQRAEREALSSKITANRDELHRLLESGSADANAVGQLVLEGRRLHEQRKALRDAEQKAIRGVLTPAQQRKFDTLLDKRRERGPGRGPDGFEGRPPGGPGERGGPPGGTPVAPGTGMPRPPQGQSRSGQQPLQF